MLGIKNIGRHKMATFFFNDQITHETVENLITEIEVCEDLDIDLYFCSIGGDSSEANVLTHYITNSIKNIKLIAYWEIASSAVDVLLYSVCKKELLEDCWGAIHLFTREIGTRDMLDKASLDLFLAKELAVENRIFIDKYKPFLTRKEVAILKKGQTVLMNHERFVSFFNTFAIKLVAPTKRKRKTKKDGEDVQS
jgi:hypothetical protein